LNDADLVVVAVERKKENPEASHATATQAGNPWSRATARWIELRSQPASGDAVPAAPSPARLVDTHP
jgi:hypothetical protein